MIPETAVKQRPSGSLNVAKRAVTIPALHYATIIIIIIIAIIMIIIIISIVATRIHIVDISCKI